METGRLQNSRNVLVKLGGLYKTKIEISASRYTAHARGCASERRVPMCSEFFTDCVDTAAMLTPINTNIKLVNQIIKNKFSSADSGLLLLLVVGLVMMMTIMMTTTKTTTSMMMMMTMMT